MTRHFSSRFVRSCGGMRTWESALECCLALLVFWPWCLRTKLVRVGKICNLAARSCVEYVGEPFFVLRDRGVICNSEQLQQVVADLIEQLQLQIC